MFRIAQILLWETTNPLPNLPDPAFWFVYPRERLIEGHAARFPDIPCPMGPIPSLVDGPDRCAMAILRTEVARVGNDIRSGYAMVSTGSTQI